MQINPFFQFPNIRGSVGDIAPLVLDQSITVHADPAEQLILFRHRDLSCRRRCGSAFICHKISDRVICLMTDSRYYRYSGIINSLRHYFLVESPEILYRTSSSSKYHQVSICSVQQLYGTNDALCSIFVLHYCGNKKNAHRVPAVQNSEYVVEHGSAFRGRHSDFLRECRKRSFVQRREEPLFFKSVL